MKKIMFALVVGLSVAAVAAVNDTLLMFSTQPTDRYSDGSQVLDGECYALCYVTDSKVFEIKPDGTAKAGGEVLLTAPVAKDGHCPNLLYVVDAAKAATLTGGEYAVYLLDTRVPKAEGGYAVAGIVDGKAKVVNAAASVVEGGTTGSDSTDKIAQLPAAPAGGTVTVALAIDNPTITAIKVDGANIKLTVADLSPLADYTVWKGTSVSKDTFEPVAATVDGSTFTVSKDGGQFFKIIGTRKVTQQ